MPQRIMIVEDDPMNAKLFQLVLTRKGNYAIEITEDPMRVIDEIKAGTVDLVIMDVSLSNSKLDGKSVDGLEITRRLKADPATRAVPVLLATAHAMKGSKEKFLKESGADDYISKPIVSADELLQRIETLIAKRSHAVPPSHR
jgi:two-component system, cell cycle response regulator DivK